MSPVHVLILVFLFLGAGVWAIYIVAGIKIITNAGYSGWWLLVTFVPLVGWVFFFVFAFSDWPVLRELRFYRQGGIPPAVFHNPISAAEPAAASTALPPGAAAAVTSLRACSGCGRSLGTSDVFCCRCGAAARAM